MPEKWYAGLNVYGETSIFNSLDILEEDEIVSYFEISGHIPIGTGPLKTDGFSKLWRELENEDELQKNFSEIVHDIIKSI